MRNPITVKTMQDAVGREAAIKENGMAIAVRVIDAKSSYGTVRLLVTPIAGSGSAWVQADRVVLFSAATDTTWAMDANQIS